MIWEIWLAVDISQGEVRLAEPGPDPVSVENVPMTLQHRFEADGSIDCVADVKRAFAYANNWSHGDTEEFPGCRPLDSNVSYFKKS